MNEDELKEWDVKIMNTEKAILEGYRIALTRAKKRRDGILNIVKSRGSVVESVLFQITEKGSQSSWEAQTRVQSPLAW